MNDTIVVGFLPSLTGHAALSEAPKVPKEAGSRLAWANSFRADAPRDPALATPDDLDKVRVALVEAGVEYHIEQPGHGHNAADELIDAVTRHDARLVVIGLRRRSLVG